MSMLFMIFFKSDDSMVNCPRSRAPIRSHRKDFSFAKQEDPKKRERTMKLETRE